MERKRSMLVAFSMGLLIHTTGCTSGTDVAEDHGAGVAQPEAQESAVRTGQREPDRNAGLGRSAELSWNAPNMRADASCLKDLAGFLVRWGRSPHYLQHKKRLTPAEAVCEETDQRSACGLVRRCTFTVRDLSPGDWYFAVYAFDGEQRISGPTQVVKKSIK